LAPKTDSGHPQDVVRRRNWMVVILRLSDNTHHTVAMEEFVANVEREMGRVRFIQVY
jgi:hypothetical protein